MRYRGRRKRLKIARGRSPSACGCQEGVQPLDPLQDVSRPRAHERVAGKGSPQGCHRRDAGGVARRHVVRRIANEQRSVRTDLELGEGEPNRLGVWLVACRGINADHDWKVWREADVGDRSVGDFVGLGRDDGERVPSNRQASDDVERTVVAPGEPIVVRVLVLSVPLKEPLEIGVIDRVGAELRDERRPDPSHPFGSGRARAGPIGERVPHGLQEQVNGVDERAVEVEQDRTRQGRADSRWQ
jgi:hypothetical protein